MAHGKRLLDGKTAFVTGGARGLGEGIARALIADGAKVAIADLRPEVEATAKALSEVGGTCIGKVLDVRDLDSFERTFNDCAEKLGGIDIMVNNAARTVQCSLWDVTPQDWDDVQATNLRSAFFGTQIAARHLRERTWGRIINLASIAGQIGGPVAGAHYATSKAGILLMTRMWAVEMAPHGTTVNAIAPGAIDGPIMEIVPSERKAFLAEQTPVKRLGNMDEVGSVAAFLASPNSGYITGATIDINGGRYMRP